jgi:hypothetical protein
MQRVSHMRDAVAAVSSECAAVGGGVVRMLAGAWSMEAAANGQAGLVMHVQCELIGICVALLLVCVDQWQEPVCVVSQQTAWVVCACSSVCWGACCCVSTGVHAVCVFCILRPCFGAQISLLCLLTFCMPPLLRAAKGHGTPGFSCFWMVCL